MLLTAMQRIFRNTLSHVNTFPADSEVRDPHFDPRNRPSSPKPMLHNPTVLMGLDMSIRGAEEQQLTGACVSLTQLLRQPDTIVLSVSLRLAHWN